MESIIMALNPATGTSIPIPLFIISGVVLVGCIVAAIIAKAAKGKDKGGKGKKK